MTATTSTLPVTPPRFGSGQAVKRLEDEALLSGKGQFTDDLVLPDQTYVSFLRSPYAHARIASLDTATAAAMPGVLVVLSGADLVAAGVQPLAGPAGFKRADGTPVATPPRRALAHERVRFVGEAVAAVVALTPQAARDAAEAIDVIFDELPVASDVASATAPGAPALCEQAPDNISAEMRHGNAAAAEAAFAQAAHVVKLAVNHQRLMAMTLEPRVALAWVAEDGRLTLRLSSQMPSGAQTTVCTCLGLKPDQVRVTLGDVGGGFGMKTGAYPEDVVVAYAAHLLKRPVKWAAERSEDFLSATAGRDVQARAEMALAADGKILALRVASHANVGAYPTGAGVAIQLLIGPWVQTSVYDIQTIDFHFKAVLTHTAPTGAYRGAGRPEAIFLMERLMDEAARQTGIDRVALRRRNFIRPEQMPYKSAMQQTYDSGKFEHVMDQGLALADWNGFAARAAESAQRGKLRGLGLATFLEWTGGNALEENVTVTVLPSGIIEVFSAVTAMGQGIATSLTQLVVDTFGVPEAQVRIVLGDTDRGAGFGSAGSRSLFTGGSAVQQGAQRTIEHARALAAQELEVAQPDLIYSAGQFTVAGTDMALGLFELAARQPEQRIELASKTAASGPTWPNGCHVSEVEVDPQTGAVQVLAYASVNDVGRVINPMIVRGQLDGGAVQGIGQALHEQVVYEQATGQLQTGSLMDYALPHADDAPPFKTEMDTSTPCLTNVLGVKGVGELGTIGATPSVVNAVADALARAGMATRTKDLQMPLSPGRLWTVMNG